VLRYGLKSLFDPTAALYVPLTFDPGLWRFLARFALRCTMKQWKRAMGAYLEVNRLALDAFDELGNGGVSSTTINAPIMVAFEYARQAGALRHELKLMGQAGQHVDVVELSGTDVGAEAPHISDHVELVLQVKVSVTWTR